MLLKVEPTNIVSTTTDILNGSLVFQNQTDFRNLLFEEWDDITNLILSKTEN